MNRRCCCMLLGAALLHPSLGLAAETAELYPYSHLTAEKPRLQRRIGELYGVLSGLIVRSGLAPAPLLDSVRLEHPFVDAAGSPLNFFSQRGPVITMPVTSLLFVEDICIAYAWLDRHGYSLETIDEYVAILQHKPTSEFAGGRVPPPLEALQIPPSAVDEPEAGRLSLRLRNSAWAFILAHEIGHVALGHPSYDQVTMAQARANEAAADHFALVVLAAGDELPVGALLFFQAAAYMLPNRGTYAAQGKSEADWEAAMRTKFTHPLTADRVQAIAAQLESQPAGAGAIDRATRAFIASRMSQIANILSDVDLQQCMAVAARRADIYELRPQPTGPSDRFLRKCVRG